MRNCPECGGEVDDAAVACRHCGARIGHDPVRDAAAKDAEPMPEKAVVLGGVVAAGMALLGGALVAVGSEAAFYGITVFLALPLATGLTAACFARPWPSSVYATLLSVAFCFFALLFTGLEGIVCIVMASPLIVGGALLGAGLGWLLRRIALGNAQLAVLPVVGAVGVFGTGVAEHRLAGPDRIEPVVTTAVFDATPEQFWNAVVAVDRIKAEQPLLLRMGLPVPERCTLEGSGVGAVRTCHFDSGTIEERVTVWDPPSRLELEIVRSTLPGRHWLGFASAAYAIEPAGPDRARVTRTTTITSKLRPAWYWRPFERLGVEAEHGYVFSCLAAELPGGRAETGTAGDDRGD